MRVFFGHLVSPSLDVDHWDDNPLIHGPYLVTRLLLQCQKQLRKDEGILPSHHEQIAFVVDMELRSRMSMALSFEGSQLLQGAFHGRIVSSDQNIVSVF